MLTSGVFLGYLIPNQKREKRETEAIKKINGITDSANNPVKFYYGYQIADPTSDTSAPVKKSSNPSPKWAQRLFGEHTFNTIKRIDFPLESWFDDSSNGIPAALADFRHLEILNCNQALTDATDLSFAAKMKQLREFSITNGSRLMSLDGVEQCKKLEKLSIHGTRIESASALSYTSNLDEAEFSNCNQLKSLAALSKHKRLRSLKILHASQLESVDFLAHLNNLETLSIQFTPAGETFDFANVCRSKNLKSLQIGFFPKMENVDMLAKLQNLESLNLQYTKSEFSFENTAFNTDSLKSLKLKCCHGINTLDGLENLDCLEELEINWCVQLEDMDAIANMKSLKKLTIRNMISRSLPKLENLPNLVYLKIKGMPLLTDLNQLKGLKAPQLESIFISDCRDLESVAALASLERIDRLLCETCPKVPMDDVDVVFAKFPDLNKRQ